MGMDMWIRGSSSGWSLERKWTKNRLTSLSRYFRLFLYKYWSDIFKGTMPRDFRPLFFSSNNSPKAPDTRVKAFLNLASYLRSKSTKLVAQRCHWHRCYIHRGGVIDTAVTCTTESLTPLWYAQRCHWHRFEMHSGVNDTPVQIWHRCDFGPHIQMALATFKGNIYKKNIHRQIDLHYSNNFHTQNMGVN
jgi:hypothetical protein